MKLILIHVVIAAYAFWESWDAAKRLRLQLIKTLVFGALGLVHGLVPAIGAPWYMRTSDPIFYHEFAACYCLCGMVALGVGWRVFNALYPVPNQELCFDYMKNEKVQRRLQILFVFCAVGGVLAWLGAIAASGATLWQLLTAKRMEFRGQGDGIIGGLCVHLFCMAYVPGFVGPQMNGRYKIAGFAYAIGFAVVLFIFSRGTRAPSIGMIGSLIGGIIFSKKLSVEKLFGSAAAMFMIGMLAVGLLPLRHRMSHMSYGEMVSFLFSAEAYQDALSHDPLNYHDHFVSITAIFPNSREYVDAASYRRILFFYLPGDSFPGLKPRDPNRIVAEALFGAAAFRVDWMHPPGVFGDVYINFWGWYGIPFMVLQGAFLAWVTRLMLIRPWFFIGIGPQAMYMSLVGIRGQPYTICVAMIASLTVTFCLLVLLGIPLSIYRKPVKKALSDSRQKHQQVNFAS
ncbi:MAG: hypothetical protein KDA80_07065 [Planctomycetaceae bacterium]|nr:hypothetical protein [Planctomycetaceae bacterium]